MDGEEDYVGQLKEVFDDCDSAGDGLINRQDLVLLCEKLQVDDHADALVERLIGTSDHKRVGFEEFKDGFVAVLSQCADLLSTEEEVSASANSFYEDGEVSPKFVRDGKKYGRRSRPSESNQGAATPLDFPDDFSDVEMDYSLESPAPHRSADYDGSARAHHNTPVNQGLASITSPPVLDLSGARVLSPTEDSVAEVYEGEGLMNKSMGTPGLDRSLSGADDTEEFQDEVEVLREIWEKQGVGKDGYLTFHELGAICENMGMEKMSDKDLEELFDKLDADRDGRVSFDEFVDGLSQHGGQADTQSNSRPHSSQGRRQLKFNSSGNILDSERRTQTPSILSAITGSGYFSIIDPEGSGYAQPEQIIEFWESFGISHDDVIAVFELLAFDLDTKISLQELSSALEQELLNHDVANSVYQVAIYSCRQELRYLKGLLDTNATERDKFITDIESSKRRNDVLIKEADERHTNQERQHETKMSNVEQKYQEQLKTLQSQLEKDRELLTTNAQKEKLRLETENGKLKDEERRLKQELAFLQKEMSNIEKELHAHIDKNSILEKDNERIKRELSSVTELHKKVTTQNEMNRLQMEEMETQRSQMTDEQNRFSEQRIQELEQENKALRDRADELTLEVEEFKMSSSRRSTRAGVGQGSRRGSLLSDYTTAAAKTDDATTGSDQSDVDSGPADNKKRKLPEPSHQEELLRIEILKLKDQFADEMSKLKKVHTTEKMDLQDAFRTELADLEQKNRKLIADMENTLSEERLNRSNSDSDWRRKYETEKAQLKLAASHDRMEMMNKLQEEHREQLKNLRQELNTQTDRETKLIRDQLTQERDLLEKRMKKKVQDYESMLDRGAESLRGKLRDDFYQLVEEQTQNEIEVEKRHLEATYQTEKDELYDLLNKEKQSMEDQFNDRLYDLEEQMDDAEENVRAECEEEFMDQIQVVQGAFNEERTEYDDKIENLNRDVERLERQMKSSVSDSGEIDRLRQQRDTAINDRDSMVLEKNQMMLARNNSERDLEKVKKSHKQEITILEKQIEELQTLSSLAPEAVMPLIEKATHTPVTSPNISAIIKEKTALAEEKKSLEESNQSLHNQLQEIEEKVFMLTSELQLTKSQHDREVQDLRLSNSHRVDSEAYSKLKQDLEMQKLKCAELQKAVNIRSTESRKLLLDSQDDHLKTITNLQYERDEFRKRLVATRKSLSEVTDLLKQQMMKSTKSDTAVRELYIENSNLVEALYVTEKRQKAAERRQLKLSTKCDSMAGAFQKFVPAVMEAVSQG